MKAALPLLAWLLGLLLGQVIHPRLALLSLALLPLVFLKKQKGWAVAISLSILAFLGSIFYLQSNLPKINPDSLSYYVGGEPVEIEGIVSEVDRLEKASRVNLSQIKINDGGWRKLKGDALVYAPLYPKYEFGDLLLINGRLEEAPAYLQNEGVLAVISFPKIELIGKDQAPWFSSTIYHIREDLALVLSQTLGEPQSSLAQGIALGLRDNIPAPVNEDFTMSGASHILAVSGLNLSIVAGALIGAGTSIFGRRHYIYAWLGLVGIWVYAALTGLGPPVVRSAIMVSLYLLAEISGRQKDSPNALLIAAAAMSLINPFVLSSVSFQMSFAATAGLIFITPLMEKSHGDLDTSKRLSGPVRSLWNNIAVTIGAVAATIPLSIYYFGTFSPLSPITSLLLLPVVTPIIIIGLSSGVLGLLFPPIGYVLGLLNWPLLTYMLAVTRIMSDLPFSSFNMEWSGMFLVGYYLILMGMTWLLRHKTLSPKLKDPALSKVGKEE